MTFSIEAPPGDAGEQRLDDCCDAIQDGLFTLIATANDAGWHIPFIFDSIEALVREQRREYASATDVFES